MTTLMNFVRYEIEFLLAGLGAVVVFQIITGRINSQGLLTQKGKNVVRAFSPARLQLLMITLAVAFYILGKVMNSIAAGVPEFPQIDSNVLVILGGSHALYLGAKSMPLPGSDPNISNK
jgi:hypothetical protein